jgi:ABC-type dipeptide/oligopeptide/nickel transport system permease component
MLLKIFVALVVLIGILVGSLAMILPREQIVHLIMFRDFFDVSLPILAFGALVKYLCTCHRESCKQSCHCSNKNG